MKLSSVARLPSLFFLGLLVSMWQGCDDNDSGEKEGGIAYADAGDRNAGDKSDAGNATSKDASADNGGSGGAGASGFGGSKAGSGGAASSAGKGGAGKGGAGGKGGKAGSGGAGAAGKAGEPAAGAGGAGTGGSSGSGGAAGAVEAGAGGAAGNAGGGGEAAGAGGEAGGGEGGGDAGEAGSGGSDGGEPSSDRCGTRGGVECTGEQFCNFEPDQDCGGTDRGGVCEATPQICNDLDQPVCGCDNRTHANSCYAHRDGTSVKHDGLCTPDECRSAGGRAVYSDGASTPECAGGEQTWSISGGDEPVVCCLPQAAPSGRTCGGIAALQCDAREFCNYESAAGGQGCDGMVADAGGKCQVIPAACTREYNPVCGCDKKSYSNACEAHANGMSILHDGACTELDCASVAGRVVYGAGPAPMCAPGEDEWTFVVDSSGVMAIEGAICCRLQ